MEIEEGVIRLCRRLEADCGDLMPETIPHVGLLIVRSDPVVETFN